MRLHEIADNDFDEPKLPPQQQLDIFVKKQAGLDYESKLAQRAVNVLLDQMGEQGFPMETPGFGEKYPTEANDAVGIRKRTDDGFYPFIRRRTTGGRAVDGYFKITPENQELLNKLDRLSKKANAAREAVWDNQEEIRKSAGRISAWKRKQPTYVGKATGKDLLTELKTKIESFIETNKWICTITNSYYWAKNKMIVIDISVTNSAPGLSINGFAKTIKVALDKFMTEQGYEKFRVTDRAVDGTLTIVKIQLDDLEAKNKAS